MTLLSRLKLFFLSKEDFSVSCEVPVDVAVERLSSAPRNPFFNIFRTTVVGNVTRSKVRLHRYIPILGNHAGLTFYGAFRGDDHSCVLEGCFRPPLSARGFWTVFLGVGLFLEFRLIFFFITGTGTWHPVVSGLGFVSLQASFFLFYLWISRNDMDSIRKVIEQSLTLCT